MSISWDDYYMEIVQAVAQKSKDRSVKIGAVIVGPDHEIRSTGYNGFPRKVSDTDESRHQRPEKYNWTEHAERNAIYNAARCGIPLKGCILFTQWLPCNDCARAIIQSGIIGVCYKPLLNIQDGSSLLNRDHYDRSREMLKEAGVLVINLNNPKEEDYE